jgi:hypothetical protein
MTKLAISPLTQYRKIEYSVNHGWGFVAHNVAVKKVIFHPAQTIERE